MLIRCLLLIFVVGCVPKTKNSRMPNEKTEVNILYKTQNLTYMAFDGKIPDYIHVKKEENFTLTGDGVGSYQFEIPKTPLMRNLSLKGFVYKDEKLIRTYDAIPYLPSVFDKKNTYTPTYPQLKLLVPLLLKDEKLQIVTSYEWMETRFIEPIFASGPTIVEIDVPHGVSFSFHNIHKGKEISVHPKMMSYSDEKWFDKNHKSQLGTKYIFDWPADEAKSQDKKLRNQLYVNFDNTFKSEKKNVFSSYNNVASFIYERIDRLELPTSQIRNFAQKFVENENNNYDKIQKIFSYLSYEIESIYGNSFYLWQPVKPALDTFNRKSGSLIDKVILCKALLESLNIAAEFAVVSSQKNDIFIDNFFSPYLFSHFVLIAFDESGVFIYDPQDEKKPIISLSDDIQGMPALIVKSQGGHIVQMPKINS